MKMSTLTATLLCRIDVQGKINVQVEKIAGGIEKTQLHRGLVTKILKRFIVSC